MQSETQADLQNVHRTAFMAAAIRAAHALKADNPKIFDDHLAARLLEMSEEEIVAFNAHVPAWSAASCVLRSRFAEDRLAAALGRVKQYVVLGAGLDTYALRMAQGLGALSVFEVDDPPLQKWKRTRIETVGLKAPVQLHFTPCDFERMSLTQALADSGFDSAAPTFVSWLGVTQYLTSGAIRETLNWAAHLAPGSEIVLTYVVPGFYAENGADARAAERRGVEFVSYFTPEEITQLLQECGFNSIEHLTPEAATERYIQNRRDGLTAPQFQRAVSAIV